MLEISIKQKIRNDMSSDANDQKLKIMRLIEYSRNQTQLKDKFDFSKSVQLIHKFELNPYGSPEESAKLYIKLMESYYLIEENKLTIYDILD